ncbi:membrane glycosyltransferase [Marivita hallyeonensis]|uniref:Glucans biosynthesis glucosyltransferase H n=2 Tax=Marivita hallyeonensis TaxID=996342 RepID=A0A1M5XCL5_9RHOB|nr:membrane glycosyltransferase [Marivita hallyeonensis]
MDGVTPYCRAFMPARAPLPMVKQDYRSPAPHRHKMARQKDTDDLWRVAAFAPALILSAVFSIGIARWMFQGGATALEVTVVALVALTFVWVSLSVSTVAIGLLRRAIQTNVAQRHGHVIPQSIAVVMPVFNEDPAAVFGNAAAMLDDLNRGPQRDRFTLFILSDSNDPTVTELEDHAFEILRQRAPANIAVHYRRRGQNTDKKVGNLTDWIENWGAGYDAFIILDADSLMSGAAMRELASALANDPDAGLVQSIPKLIGAETLFGRMQQFSNAVYGWLLAEGLSTWSQRESNYWGHNAIVRTRAFASSAHLPRLRSWRGREKLVLSHDFVEAAMLRRSGWSVRFLPQSGGSYEETPQTLIDYALRDRRWCQGNLQHLRLLGAQGFHPLSRFHMLQGAVAFLLSPAWLALILIWAWLGTQSEAAVVYFSATNPLYPVWPTLGSVDGTAFLAIIFTMLLLPKAAGAVALAMHDRTRRDYGGWASFAMTTGFEIICAILFAPILMVQQSIAVGRALLGHSSTWIPQNRVVKGHTWSELLRFHWIETLLGIVAVLGIGLGAISPWLLPIAVSLVFAVPLSKLSALPLGRALPLPFRLETPQSLREPRILRQARSERAQMLRRLKDAPQRPLAIAAE